MKINQLENSPFMSVFEPFHLIIEIFLFPENLQIILHGKRKDKKKCILRPIFGFEAAFLKSFLYSNIEFSDFRLSVHRRHRRTKKKRAFKIKYYTS